MSVDTLAVILPCFNEEANIAATVSAVRAWMEGEGIMGEIIVVNDGSTDGTGEVLRTLEREMPLRVITHPHNLGYGAAVRAGCDAATAEWIGFMDSDGQFDPRDFDKLLPFASATLAPAFSLQREMGYDVVVGRRRKRADLFLRKVNAKLFGMLSFLVLGIWVRDVNCAMKIFRRDVWRRARPVVTTGALFNAEFFYNLKRQGIPWMQVDVSHYPRRGGKQTGANPMVILRMLRELMILRMKS